MKWVPHRPKRLPALGTTGSLALSLWVGAGHKMQSIIQGFRARVSWGLVIPEAPRSAAMRRDVARERIVRMRLGHVAVRKQPISKAACLRDWIGQALHCDMDYHMTRFMFNMHATS